MSVRRGQGRARAAYARNEFIRLPNWEVTPRGLSYYDTKRMEINRLAILLRVQLAQGRSLFFLHSPRQFRIHREHLPIIAQLAVNMKKNEKKITGNMTKGFIVHPPYALRALETGVFSSCVLSFKADNELHIDRGRSPERNNHNQTRRLITCTRVIHQLLAALDAYNR